MVSSLIYNVNINNKVKDNKITAFYPVHVVNLQIYMP